MADGLNYQVFVEQRDRSPAATAQVARAIAARFGVAEQDFARRLASGRFCVRARVDLATARKLAAELEALGVVCEVVEAAASRPPPPPPAALSPPAPAASPFQSGLAAARPGAEQDLGVLAGDPQAVSAGLRISTLDGTEEEEPAGSNPAAPSPAPAGASPFAPAQAFLPPEMVQERELELAVDPAAASRPMPAAQPGTPAAPAPLRSPAGGGTASVAPAWIRARGALADQPRPRLVVGVLLAVLLGFIPAHLVGALREGPAYEPSRRDLLEAYAGVTSIEDWEGLDELRSSELALMRSRQVNIAVSAGLVWALGGAGFAFLWFRKIDWQRWQSRPARSAGTRSG